MSFSILILSYSSYQLHQRAMFLSAPYSEGACRCSVEERQGNPSCHRPCSHSLPHALCRRAACSAVEKLQRLQDAGLRIVTSSLQMTSISHLHRECVMLSVSDSFSLTCKQYLAGALCRNITCPPPLPLIQAPRHTGSPMFSVFTVCQTLGERWCSSV